MTEETDEDGRGGFTSHFELYLDAMGQAGADTRAIDDFIARIRRREDVGHALDCCAAPPGACRFVNTTFNVIRSGELHRIAACFTFGREDIIPEMFRNIVEEIRKSNSARIERFIYYLDRHIESTPTTMVRWRSRWLRPYVATAPSNGARPRRPRSPR